MFKLDLEKASWITEKEREFQKNIYFCFIEYTKSFDGFPSISDGKASACSGGDLGSIPRSRRSPGKGNGNPFQYSCLENFMDRGAWQATVHGVAESQIRLSD